MSAASSEENFCELEKCNLTQEKTSFSISLWVSLEPWQAAARPHHMPTHDTLSAAQTAQPQLTL